MTLFRHRPPSREQVLADIQRQLRDGRPVELIGPTGEPRWFDVVAGGRGSPYVSDADGTFRIATDEVALIDLPPTGLDRYRFEVQIQGQVASPATRFGAYAGRHRLPSTHGPTDCFATLWFNEQAKYRDRPGPDSPAQLGVRYHQQVPGTGSVLGGHSVAAGPPSAMPIGVSVPWRTIAVDVLPDRMTWSFDGDPAGSITLPLVPPDEGLFAQSAGLLPGMTTAFAPAGGYGLVVHRGTAAVRNARLVPIER
jgi:hypothetical protein